jgi:two-component system sensor histidine kinase ChvG
MRFYTYRPTAYASRGDNSGLGLSISREIVHAHNGEIWAENIYADGAGGDDSAPRRRIGARFVVRLPASGPGRG